MTLQGKRILLVEDDVVRGVDLAYVLESEGARTVGPIRRLAQTLELLDRDGEAAFGGAILDVELKDGESFPVADRLRLRGVPYLFYTAKGSAGHDRARTLGVPVFGKGRSAAEVIAGLAALIEGRARR